MPRPPRWAPGRGEWRPPLRALDLPTDISATSCTNHGFLAVTRSTYPTRQGEFLSLDAEAARV
ncbi:hypothetical protein E4U58_007168, partial [Claviceps cyperi]